MASTQADEGTKGAVTLRFTGTGSGRRTYIGPVTGERYMFDAEEFQTRRVHPDDAKAMLAMGAFEEVKEEKKAAKKDEAEADAVAGPATADTDAEVKAKADEKAKSEASAKKE